MNESYERLKPYMEKAQALQTAMVLGEWDNETLAPRQAAPSTARMSGAISPDVTSSRSVCSPAVR